ncbi:two-CW domain-containing protein [Psychromonas aquimarina]|uniref:two-CW domain-containing protein n=1 Tax=Psychromonas aquimarina TaxID=444919 RepID=UPI0003F85B2C|nr:hypothetical protein [Psychromonas aquimarina]
MKEKLQNCWQIMDCGREKGGVNAAQLGECIAAKQQLVHSCWAAAGTFCSGEVQGTMAQKIGYCTCCRVHKLYNRSLGEKGQEVRRSFPEEEVQYNNLLLMQPV